MAFIKPKGDVPELKINKAQGTIRFYFAFYPKNKEECEKYFVYLREFEEATKDSNDRSTIQVHIFAPKNFPPVVSLLSSCFMLRDDDYESYKWHNFTKADNSHHMILLKSPKLPDVDDFLQIICDTMLVNDSKEYLIINYNFAINS